MDILVSGSIAYDYLMRFPGKFTDSLVEQKLDKVSLSFLVDDMTRHYGGAAANIVYTLALLGYKPKLMGTAGQDFQMYRERLDALGVDTSTVIQLDHVFTASFFCNTDVDNNQIASFYAGAMGLAGNYGLSDVIKSKPDLVLISPDDPAAMQRRVRECREQNIPYLFDPSQQVARVSGDFLREGVEGCYMLLCNEYEWEVIQKNTGLTLDELQQAGKIFVHTLGADGANIYTDNQVFHIPVFQPAQTADPTGAGDAFRGGLLRGLSLNLPWEVAGRMGALSACYALEHIGAQNHHFTLEQFIARYRTQADDQGALDALLNG